MSTQEYEVTLDLNYIADRQWEREEMQKEKDELQQTIDQLQAEWVCGQQMLHGSTQTVQLNDPPLQNSTAIGGGNGPSNRLGLTLHGPCTVYVPPTELAEKRQATALHSESTLKNPYLQLGPRERTNMLPSEVKAIDAVMAMATCKVHIRQLAASMQNWNWWCYDFEVAMMGADIPKERWVAVLPATWMIQPETHMKNSRDHDEAIRQFLGMN